VALTAQLFGIENGEYYTMYWLIRANNELYQVIGKLVDEHLKNI
jgi:hypothetical protein